MAPKPINDEWLGGLFLARLTNCFKDYFSFFLSFFFLLGHIFLPRRGMPLNSQNDPIYIFLKVFFGDNVRDPDDNIEDVNDNTHNDDNSVGEDTHFSI